MKIVMIGYNLPCVDKINVGVIVSFGNIYQMNFSKPFDLHIDIDIKMRKSAKIKTFGFFCTFRNHHVATQIISLNIN